MMLICGEIRLKGSKMEIVLKIDNFEGPLDLLLHLIEKKKMEISEIKISQIIDDYLIYIETAKEKSLTIKVEFLEIASELLEIKALSILSVNKEVEKEKDLRSSLYYLGIIIIFILGGILGAELTKIFQGKAVLFSCLGLFIGFLMMFVDYEKI